MSSVPQPQAMQKVETSPLISKLADRYGMTPKTMIDTIIATVFPNAKASIPQLMMFMQVAEQYNLNPFTKEIYAFPSKGGIVPIVPVDGWTNIINSHPQYDGVEFIDAIGQDGRIISVTCIIYRKDRNHPTQVTEYLDECNRDTEPWKRWPKRMLRHKALIQCARVAFSLAGIFEQDEAERIMEAESTRPEILRPTPIVVATVDHSPEPEPQPEPAEEPSEAHGMPGVFDNDAKPQPAGPYVEKYQKLFVIAAGAGIKVVKGSHDDELHKYLKKKWGIESVKQIPVSLWDRVLEDVGKSLAVKQP
jgi:phage recombination protein Bet